ncbi:MULTISPECIES: EAL domain-containing protein [unclassified Cyanobium]|uniref:putative bifunctional diguanylate cyclase/phosphodiesterase n=1 Tax=unclassified Cyanobium TaxID=2627006 RepID=UPI0020CF4422|nr:MULTISPECIES: EAL domain-containing protein [unclassified Cyanobium]MCP9797801.1 EAL domain-containing protein [Cyanobium sp. Lug-B]MCP9934329.1 EAL domain-containing protein [Cyanobium sp. Candia 9D4]
MPHGDLSKLLLQLLAQTAEAFIVEPTSELDATIDRTLASIGGLFDVDRAYVFSLTRYPGFASNTHEWCAPGVEPQMHQLQHVSEVSIGWLMGEMRSGRAVNLESLLDLPAGADAERAHLSAQGIQSLLVLPLVRRGQLEGFAGFDHIRGCRRWSDQEVAVLSIVVSGFAQGFERRLIDEQLRQLAYEDPLTRLPNRSLLSQRLGEELERARRNGTHLAVGYLDLDNFKPVNDSHGHAVGDELLVAVAERLCRCLRPGDTVGRLGGDEFVVILPGLSSLAELESLGERLLSAVAQPTHLGETLCVALSTSIGFRLVPPDDADPDTLLRQADQAMYAAKRAGPGRMHHFDVELERRQSLQRSRLERVRQAIEAQQLRLFVQPVIDLATGQLRFAEALVRWQHPQQGLLAPEAWLGWIEDQPEITRLGDWVLEQALRHCSAWMRAGPCVAVSVNMSARELRDPGFAERIRAALALHPELPGSALRLEVLETAALEDLELVAQNIARCRDLGVSFALDDFGTGYSSLTYLRRLPIATIKIDRSFVARMLVDPADRAIVKAVVDLAHAFGRTCVAEGVETAEHLQVLRAMGCELAQGFAIARPMPAEDLPGWSLPSAAGG